MTREHHGHDAERISSETMPVFSWWCSRDALHRVVRSWMKIDSEVEVIDTDDHTSRVYLNVLIWEKLNQGFESIYDPPYLIHRRPVESPTCQSQLDSVMSLAEPGRRDILDDRVENVEVLKSTVHDAFDERVLGCARRLGNMESARRGGSESDCGSLMGLKA